MLANSRAPRLANGKNCQSCRTFGQRNICQQTAQRTIYINIQRYFLRRLNNAFPERPNSLLYYLFENRSMVNLHTVLKWHKIFELSLFNSGAPRLANGKNCQTCRTIDQRNICQQIARRSISINAQI